MPLWIGRNAMIANGHGKCMDDGRSKQSARNDKNFQIAIIN